MIIMNEGQPSEPSPSEPTKSSSSKDISQEKVSLEIKAKSNVYEIEVSIGCSVSDISQTIDGIIKELEKSKKFAPKSISSNLPTISSHGVESFDEDPLSLFATKLELDYNSLKESKLISIKNQTAQILKPTALSPTESCYLLLAANEYALGKKSLAYDEWKELCDASKIKSKTPFYKIVDNAKRYGHINQKAYDKSKEIILEGRGLETVKKAVLKYLSK